MKKERFKDISLDDKSKIRKERKALVAYVIGIVLCVSFYKLIAQRMTISPVGFGYGQPLAIILVLLGIASAIASVIALTRLTKLIYKQPTKYFSLYIIFIFSGFVFGIVLIITLLVIWLETRKLFKE